MKLLNWIWFTIYDLYKIVKLAIKFVFTKSKPVHTRSTPTKSDLVQLRIDELDRSVEKGFRDSIAQQSFMVTNRTLNEVKIVEPIDIKTRKPPGAKR